MSERLKEHRNTKLSFLHKDSRSFELLGSANALFISNRFCPETIKQRTFGKHTHFISHHQTNGTSTISTPEFTNYKYYFCCVVFHRVTSWLRSTKKTRSALNPCCAGLRKLAGALNEICAFGIITNAFVLGFQSFNNRNDRLVWTHLSRRMKTL